MASPSVREALFQQLFTRDLTKIDEQA